MKLTIKYFGMLAEAVQKQEETFSVAENSVSAMLKALYSKYPMIENMDFQVAENNQIVSKDAVITSSEIALLPPFAGG